MVLLVSAGTISISLRWSWGASIQVSSCIRDRRLLKNYTRRNCLIQNCNGRDTTDMVLGRLQHDLGIRHTFWNFQQVRLFKTYFAAICLASNLHYGSWHVSLLYLLVVLSLAMVTQSKHRHGTYSYSLERPHVCSRI